MTQNAIFFLNDADIKTISEFKDSFGKYYPVVKLPENLCEMKKL